MQVQIISTTGRFSISLHRSRVYQRPISYKAEIVSQISTLFQGIPIKDPNGLIGQPLERDKELEVRLPDLANYIVGTKTLERIFKDKKTDKAQIATLDENDIKNIWIYKGDMSQNDYNDLVLLKWDAKKKELEIEAAHSENEFSVLTDTSFKLLIAQTNNVKRDELRPIVAPSINAASAVQARRDLNAIDVKDKIIKAFTTSEIINDFPTPQELEATAFTPEHALEIINVLTKHTPPGHLMNHTQYLGSNRSIRNTFKVHIAEYTKWLKTNISTSFFAFGLTGSGDAVLVKALEMTYSETEVRDAKLRKEAAANKSSQQETPTPSTRTSTPPSFSSSSSHPSRQTFTTRPTTTPASFSSTTPPRTTTIAATPPKPTPTLSNNGAGGSEPKETHKGRVHLLERSSGEELLAHVFSNDPAFYDSLRRSISAEYKDNEKMVFFAQRKDVIGPRSSVERLDWAKKNPDHCFSQGLGLNERLLDDKIVKKEDRVTLNTWANEDTNKETKFAKSLKILFERHPESLKISKPEITAPINQPPLPQTLPISTTPHQNNGHTTSSLTHKGTKSIIEKVHGEALLTYDFGTSQTLYNNIHKAMTADFTDNENMVFFGQRKDVITWKSAQERLQWAQENPNHCFSQGLGLNQNLLNDKNLHRDNRIALNKWANEDANKNTRFAISLRNLFEKHPESLEERVPEPVIVPEHSHKNNGKVPHISSMPTLSLEITDLSSITELVRHLSEHESTGILVDWMAEHPDHPLTKALLDDDSFVRTPFPRPLAERLLRIKVGV